MLRLRVGTVVCLMFSLSVLGMSGCATVTKEELLRRERSSTNERLSARRYSTTKADESSSVREASHKPSARKGFVAEAGELSFVGESYDENPDKARGRAKSEALEKMLASLVGIDVEQESIDKVSYSKVFSGSPTLQEKGEIDFRRTLTISSGGLKGLKVRVDSSCSKEGDLFHAVIYVFVDKKEAEKARMRGELERALLEVEDSRTTSIQVPENPGSCLREAITILAEKFTSAIGKHEDVTRIAVLDIAGDSYNSLREEMIMSFFKRQEYELVERRGAVLEQKLGLSEIIDSRTAVSPGKLLGVDATISGRIKKVEEKDESASLEVYLKMLNVETGKIIWAGVVEGHSTRGPINDVVD